MREIKYLTGKSLKLFSILCWISASLIAKTVWGQESNQNQLNSDAYRFSGPCSSQGSWTQAALAQTENIKDVIRKLKDNPSCKALANSMTSSLTDIQSEINNIHTSNDDQDTNRLLSLPKEISSLRTFSTKNPKFKNDVSGLLLDKVMSQMAISSQTRSSGNINSAVMKSNPIENLSPLGSRVLEATQTGLRQFNSVINSMTIASADCLDAPDAANFAAFMTQAISSFASAGQSTVGSQFAETVHNLTNFITRDKKYIDELKKLTDRQFLTSMSCLIEISSEGYCSTRDARYLFDEIITDPRVVKSQSGKITGTSKAFNDEMTEGPLSGFYILSKQVPVISDWLLKVQLGNEAQLPTDADFKNNVQTTVINVSNTKSKIEGNFNVRQKILMELSDVDKKKNYLYSMIGDSIQTILGGTDTGENFFTQVYSPIDMTFKLLDLETPKIVKEGSDAGIQQGPLAWLQANYQKLGIFENPDQLALRFKENLSKLFVEAQKNSDLYYTKYYIVDQQAIVNDSLLGLDTDVRSALINIDIYLKYLQNKIGTTNPVVIGSIVDTRKAIGKILSRYADLRTFGIKIMNQKSLMNEAEFDESLKKLGSNLLQEVYKQFSVMQARTSWLSVRMRGFVLLDYQSSIRERDGGFVSINKSDSIQEQNRKIKELDNLYFSTGFNSLTQMMNLSQLEPSKATIDMDQAMNIHKKNLSALENIFGASLQRNLNDLKNISESKSLTTLGQINRANNLAFHEAYDKMPDDTDNANIVSRFARGALNMFKFLWTSDQNFEKYGMPKGIDQAQYFWDSIWGKRKIVTDIDTEFGSAENELSKLCIQTLAFTDQRPYWIYCKNATLRSPLVSKNLDPEIQKIQDSSLSINYVKKAYDGIEATKKDITKLDRQINLSNRICALRDYHKQNQVAWATSAMRQGNQTYQNEYTNTISDTGIANSKTSGSLFIGPTQTQDNSSNKLNNLYLHNGTKNSNVKINLPGNKKN